MESPLKGIKTRQMSIDSTVTKDDDMMVAAFIASLDMRIQQMCNEAQAYLTWRN